MSLVRDELLPPTKNLRTSVQQIANIEAAAPRTRTWFVINGLT
jgi:hypothetical protein